MPIPEFSAIAQITSIHAEAYKTSQHRGLAAPSSPSPRFSLPKPVKDRLSSEGETFIADDHPSAAELHKFEPAPANPALLSFDRQITRAYQEARHQPAAVKARMLEDLDRLYYQAYNARNVSDQRLTPEASPQPPQSQLDGGSWPTDALADSALLPVSRPLTLSTFAPSRLSRLSASRAGISSCLMPSGRRRGGSIAETGLESIVTEEV
jgi:hypothetical protein